MKEVEPLGWHRLEASQVTRSVRLLSILKVCLSNHSRASLVLKNFEESKYNGCCAGVPPDQNQCAVRDCTRPGGHSKNAAGKTFLGHKGRIELLSPYCQRVLSEDPTELLFFQSQLANSVALQPRRSEKSSERSIQSELFGPTSCSATAESPRFSLPFHSCLWVNLYLFLSFPFPFESGWF